MEADAVDPRTCPRCDLVFSTKQRLKYHIDHDVCLKPALVCLKCDKKFLKRYRYNDHVATCTQGDQAQPLPNVAGPSANNIGRDVNGDVVTTINNGDNVTNNYNINGFSTTDIELVKQAILRDPSLLQLAHEMECVHEQLTAMTHFHGAAANRNVVSGDMKTSTMKVINGAGQAMKITRTEGEDAIYFRNAKIANSASVRPLVNGDLFMSLDAREQRRDKRKIAVTVENKGAYAKYDAVRRELPVFEPLRGKERDAVWDSMLDRVSEAAYWPPPGLAEDACLLLTVFVRHPRLWMRLPDGFKILAAEEFKAAVYEQTERIMEEFHGMCYRRYDRGGMTKKMFAEVERHVYDFGANVMSAIYVEGGGRPL
jgi:hypothetical protein